MTEPLAACFRAFCSELNKIASGESFVPPAGVPGTPPPASAPSGVRRRRAPLPYLATEHAEHVTDLGGLGMMMGSSADRLYEGVTGKSHLGETGRDLVDLAGLGLMAAPSIQAVQFLQKNRARKGMAGGGSRGANLINAASLAALALPTVDRLQARLRGRPEEGRFLGDRAHAALELAGYGGLTGVLARSKAMTPLKYKQEHQGLNRQLLGYGILAAPELSHLMHGDHLEHPNYDAQGNPIPSKPSILRPITDMVGLSLLGAPVLKHMGHG